MKTILLNNYITRLFISAVFVLSNKGKRLVLLNDYTYSARKEGNNHKIRWMCSTHHARGCNAVVHTIFDTIVYTKEIHNHPPPFKYTVNIKEFEVLKANK